MTYQYQCNKCNQAIDYTCSINEETPYVLKCVCGGDMKYDWRQFSMSTVLIPERHKA